jgi:hypothetical protein
MSGKSRVLALAAAVMLLATSQSNAQMRNYGYGPNQDYGFGLAPAPMNSYMPYRPLFFGVAPYGVYAPNSSRSIVGFANDQWNLFSINNLIWGDNYGVNWGTGMINPFVGAYGESPYAAADNSLILPRPVGNPVDSLENQLYAQQIQNGLAANPHVKVVVPTGKREKEAPQAAYTVTGLITRGKLMDASGKVRWPAAAPSDDKFGPTRQAAEAAVKTAVDEYQKNKIASAKSVAEARRALAAYANPALEKLRADSPADAVGLEVFTQSLDQTLAAMGEAPQVRPGVIEVPRVRSTQASAAQPK